MNCTQCNTALMTVPYIQQHMVEYCRSCHGMWVQKSVLDLLATEAVEAADLQLMALHMTGPIHENDKTLACPSCNEFLSDKKHAACELQLKACPSHGIWFSKEQLMALEQFLQSDHGTDRHKQAFFSSI